MAKSKNEITTTAAEYQRSGERYYRAAADMEDRNESQKKIDANWQSAAMDFWWALTLGSEKAPFSLFKCFGQGLGVKQDTGIAALFYGVALKLTPQDCTNIPTENRPAAPDKAMKSRIDDLLKLVKQTHSKISDKDVTMDKVLEQMDKFDKAIKLPGGKSIESCFVKKSTTHDEHEASTSAHNASYETCPDTSLESFEDQGDVAMGGVSHLHVCCSVM